MQQADVVIAGAGIVGLSLALRLRRKGRSVLVVERRTPGSGASTAAAGMLAAHDPANPAELSGLAERSLSLYPGYLAELEEHGGQHVPFETEWTLERSSEKGVGTGPGALPVISPAAGPFRLHREWSLDPRKLFASLLMATQQAGVAFLHGRGVAGTHSEQGFLTITLEDGTNIYCEDFIECTGAWSSRHAHPVKGQMLRLRPPEGALAVDGKDNVVVRTPLVYLVPRLDGTCLVGATVEDAGFDEQVRPESSEWLRQRAAEVVPDVIAWPEVESWCGLRPGTASALPVLGQMAEREFIANGLYRNGILLAPAVTESIALLVEGRPPEVALTEFSPQSLALLPGSRSNAGSSYVLNI